MSITWNNRRRYDGLHCDNCGTCVENLDSFNDVLKHKKENGWVSFVCGGNWYDTCPECEEERKQDEINKNNKLLMNNLEEKFFVLKIEDINKYLAKDKINDLISISNLIQTNRRVECKKENFYVVINTDEPYIDEIIDILKRYKEENK